MAGEDRGSRRWELGVGTAYGFIWGLSFALLVWGYDALVLARNHAELPWAKLLIGLPVCLALCTLLGLLNAVISFGPLAALLGALAGGFLCWLAGHVPYEGVNLVSWVVHPDLWGVDLFPYGRAAEVRMWLTVPTGVILGAGAGYLQTWAVEWAWNASGPGGRMRPRAWLALTICVPFLLVTAVVIDTMVSAPLRAFQVRMAETIEKGRSGAAPEEQDVSHRSIVPYRERLAGPYTTYLAVYDTESLYFGYVDVAFASGPALRCSVVGEHVVYCEDFGARAAGWMDDLIHAGRSGERRWLQGPARVLAVEEEAVDWLSKHGAQMQGRYQVQRVDQSGGWFRLAARFEDGFVLVCRFHGMGPVVVDRCTAGVDR